MTGAKRAPASPGAYAPDTSTITSVAAYDRRHRAGLAIKSHRRRRASRPPGGVVQVRRQRGRCAARVGGQVAVGAGPSTVRFTTAAVAPAGTRPLSATTRSSPAASRPPPERVSSTRVVGTATNVAGTPTGVHGGGNRRRAAACNGRVAATSAWLRARYPVEVHAVATPPARVLVGLGLPLDDVERRVGGRHRAQGLVPVRLPHLVLVLVVAITTSRPGPTSESISSMSAVDAATDEPTKPTSSAPTPMIHTGGSKPAARHWRSTVDAPSGLSARTRVPVPAQ